MIWAKAEPFRRAFSVGTCVRVKTHVMDPDFPGLSLGGWAGEVVDVQEGNATSYLVRWSRITLQGIHPAFRDRCEMDDLCFDRIWLMETDLEPDF